MEDLSCVKQIADNEIVPLMGRESQGSGLPTQDHQSDNSVVGQDIEARDYLILIKLSDLLVLNTLQFIVRFPILLPRQRWGLFPLQQSLTPSMRILRSRPPRRPERIPP